MNFHISFSVKKLLVFGELSRVPLSWRHHLVWVSDGVWALEFRICLDCHYTTDKLLKSTLFNRVYCLCRLSLLTTVGSLLSQCLSDTEFLSLVYVMFRSPLYCF